MPLQPGQPGLWTNPEWDASKAGTFAVIIGISSYPYLDGGDGVNRPAENYDLGQLSVSAMTAAHFFDWLRAHYRINDAPLAKCWLLLAPNKDEEKAYGGPFPASTLPTMDACTSAIQDWFGTVSSLPAAVAEQSRTLFFFSGHGVDVGRNKQLLLPCDYLRPPAHVASAAISTANISNGMATLPARCEFFFIDACRNDLERLRETRNLDGTPILDEKSANWSNPTLVGPIVYATGSGSVAWSPENPKDGISYFGQAILEAFRGESQFPADCDGQECRVEVFTLSKFLDARLPALIPVRGRDAAVTLGGYARNGVITQVRRPKRRLKRTIRPPPPLTVRPEPELTSVPLPSTEWRPSDPIADPYSVLQSEFASGLLGNAVVVPLTRDPAVPSNLIVHRVGRTADRDFYRIDVSAPGGAYWLQLPDHFTQRTYAIVLPGDTAGTPLYRVEWSTEIRDGEAFITRLHARLSPLNSGHLKEAAAVWELYHAVDLTATLNSADLASLVQRLGEKVTSPLAAVVAGTILLRLRAYDLLDDWLRDLADSFTDIPDGPVLWGAQMLQSDQAVIENGSLLKYVLEMRTRGLPYTGEALGYADQQVRILLKAKSPTSEERNELEILRSQIEDALRYFRSGGLLAVFVGDMQAITSALITPA